MAKLLSWRFQQCLGLFTMLLVEGFSEMGLLAYLSNHVFQSLELRKYISYKGQFFSKCSKVNVDFKNAENNSEKDFCFLKNCIWIGCIKLPLLRKQHLSSEVNVLTNTPKILHMTKRDIQLNLFHRDQ